jgi:hypothetical protein
MPALSLFFSSLAVIGLFALVPVGQAQAQPSASATCVADRAECEAAIVERCPQGATITSERLGRAPEGPRAGERIYVLEHVCGIRLPEESALHSDWVRRKQEERALHRLGPPLGALGAGLALFLVPTSVLVISPEESASAGFIAVAALSGAILVAGSVWLAKVVRKRRAISSEIAAHAALRPPTQLPGLAWRWAL